MKTLYTLVGIISLSILTSCGEHAHEKEEHITFIATTPLLQDTTVTKEYVCQVHAIQHIDVRALEKGYLQKIYVDEGQTVKEGQIMFRIMPILYEAEVAKAKAEVDLAEIEYRNTKILSDSNVVSKNELAMAKANLDRAKAQLELARAHLGFTEIKAPFTGIMDRFHVRVGSLLDEGELLTNLSDNSKMWVYFNVPEAEYIEYKKKELSGQQTIVDLIMANGENFMHQGIVETVEADFNNETGNIAFRATFENPEGLLRHGETGNIQMTVPFKNALIIPQKATFEILEKKYVFVIDARNIVHQREVTVAAEMPDLFVISNGLKKGDRILLEGIRKVNNGDKISYKLENPKDVIPKLKVYVE